jgi:hypothetical protein
LTVSLGKNSISVALTIEPRQYDHATLASTEHGDASALPSEPLHALQVVTGYMLPDPETPDRFTVWFTGGSLSPVPPPGYEGKLTDYVGFEEWKTIFGGDHKRSWGQSFRVMGAKLFLGAELPDGMGEDGTMAYTLRRPFGGHGKGYVDVSTY